LVQKVTVFDVPEYASDISTTSYPLKNVKGFWL
jgi:hypothetical protein